MAKRYNEKVARLAAKKAKQSKEAAKPNTQKPVRPMSDAVAVAIMDTHIAGRYPEFAKSLAQSPEMDYEAAMDALHMVADQNGENITVRGV